jgi:hypothetical protein
VEASSQHRPHLRDIASGLFEARVSGVDFWDTQSGQALLRAISERGGAAHEPRTGHGSRLRGQAWARLHLSRRHPSSRKAGPS